jgi:hypothetical protein
MQQITITLDLTADNIELLRGLFTNTTPTAIVVTTTEQSNQPSAAPEEQPITKTELRTLAAKLSKAEKQDVLKEIFAKFNAEKLSNVQEEDYAALKEDLVNAID